MLLSLDTDGEPVIHYTIVSQSSTPFIGTDATLTTTFDNILVVEKLFSEIVDNDNDGFDNTVDCNDNNAEVNPEGIEVVYNGIDDDCNPLTLDDDLDQDGYTIAEDCDDNNPNVSPGAIDIPNNEMDEDCNGLDATAPIIYVDISALGNNDGSSWDNAFTDLESALQLGEDNDQIWVSEGTYLPGGDAPTNESTFLIDKNYQIYGGFSGTETSLLDRDIELNEVILSGDLLMDDNEGDTYTSRTDNVRHVITLPINVSLRPLINGVTISSGHTEGGSGSNDERRGGGLYSPGASPTIEHCTFVDNYGYFGGATHFRGFLGSGEVKISNTSFINNRSQFGGVAYCNHTMSEFFDCIFDDNSSSSEGGAVYCNDEITNFTRCEFTNNSGRTGGGAIAIHKPAVNVVDCNFVDNSCQIGNGGHISDVRDEGDPAENGLNIINSTFSEGTGINGGAIYSFDEGSILNISNSEFNNNRGLSRGGAVFTSEVTSVSLTNLIINNNTADSGGGIYHIGDETSYEISDCIVTENMTNIAGGGIYLECKNDNLASPVSIKRTQISNNETGGHGGALATENCSFEIDNCLIVNNVALDDTGGGIHIESLEDACTFIEIENCTISKNEAADGGNVFVDVPGNCTELFLSNTIVSHAIIQSNISITSNTTVFSFGGNLFDTNVPEALVLADLDDVEVDPMFVNVEQNNFYLSANSTAIDRGVDVSGISIDLDNVTREGLIDKGCYESSNVDEDNDGFSIQEDCDDGDPSINPEAIDIPDNGIDENCDGFDGNQIVDNDSDGFPEDVDCDDNNPDVNPDTEEITYNGIDDEWQRTVMIPMLTSTQMLMTSPTMESMKTAMEWMQ